MASQTDLQFNLVRVLALSGDSSPTMAAAQPSTVRADRAYVVMLQVSFVSCCLLVTAVAITYMFTRSKPVYLIDFHVFKAPAR